MNPHEPPEPPHERNYTAMIVAITFTLGASWQAAGSTGFLAKVWAVVCILSGTTTAIYWRKGKI